jgi:F-type H+-transporting ATPase subunit gamma
MPEAIERTQARLQNISIVKPLLEALKTISLGSWQAAQRTLRTGDAYRARLMEIMPHVASPLKPPRMPFTGSEELRIGLLVVIGSERGLCGNFNRDLVKETRLAYDRLSRGKYRVQTQVFGKTVGRILQREFGQSLEFSIHPMPSVPTSKMAGEWSAAWLTEYNLGKIDTVEIVFNQNVGASSYKTQTTSLIPIILPEIPERSELWPELILDNEPRSIFITLVRQFSALDLFHILLSSSIAEHSTRYRLMDEASRNADDLIEELTLDVQASRRQAITQEMEELAVGAGLL